MANSSKHFSEIGGARMHIECVEIQNFKKLKSCRVEFTDKTTIFVGANNSGKTSAMDALRKFLDKKSDLL
ncbi:ATP-binding protein [Paenibacillus sp. UKAQ_18]|nr:ATP-binding protein [Paenibacillus sp. UKAQ_18]